MTPSRAAEVLGVDLGVSVAELKARWRQLAKELHPDVAGPGHLDAFIQARAAYDVLLPIRVSAEQWCGHCGGLGQIFVPGPGFGGVGNMPCPACHGTGRT